MNILPKLHLIALFFFIIATVFGLIIRIEAVFSIFYVDFGKIIQAHSHIAFLGWGYLGSLYILINHYFNDELKNNKSLNYSVWILVITIVGMLFSFPIYGYKSFSIILLSLFLLVSYFTSYLLLKNCKKEDENISLQLIKYGIWFYILSSLFIWLIPIAISQYGKTEIYKNLIYQYLHFLYNGYFTLSILGFTLQKIKLKSKNRILILLITGTLLTSTLSFLWSSQNLLYNFLGGFGALLLLTAIYIIINSLSKNGFFKEDKILKYILIAFIIKKIIQVFSAIPYIQDQAISLKSFYIIGYIHLFTLVIMSTSFLVFFKKMKGEKYFLFFILNLILVGVLFLKGVLAEKDIIFYNYNEIVLLISSFIFFIICIVFAKHYKSKN